MRMIIYNQSEPDIDQTVVITYVYLRYGLNVVQCLFELSPEPSSQVCAKKLSEYVKVLQNLHLRIIHCQNYIPGGHANQIVWNEELDITIHELLFNYFSATYQHIFARVPVLQTQDCLFGCDVEYKRFVPSGQEEEEIKNTRYRALAKRPDNEYLNPAAHNVLNIGIHIQNFVEAFIWIYQFFARVEPKFPIARNLTSKDRLWTNSLNLDANLRNQWTALPLDQKNTLFIVPAYEVQIHAMTDPIASLIPFLYTLKLYSFGFIIQKHCIDARNVILNERPADSQFTILDFIVDYLVIEHPLRDSIDQFSPMAHIFDLKIQRLNQFFVNFYGGLGIWGKPDHENYSLNTHDFMAYAEAGLRQYKKLWIFLREGGTNRIRFREIVQHFIYQLSRIRQQSKAIRDRVIATAIQCSREYPQFQYDIETMDVLVLYLMRASSYCIVSAVFALFKQLHTEVESQVLIQMQRTYTMGRPGWVQFFSTFTNILNILNSQRTNYLIYDDELDRISNTLDDTKRIIQNIFRHYYFRLINAWILEITEISDNLRLNQYNVNQERDLVTLVFFQVMFGLAFTAKFHSIFRMTFRRQRRRIFRFFRLCQGHPQQSIQNILVLQQFVNNYMANNNDIVSAHPPTSQSWLLVLQNFPDIQVLQPQQVGLDLAAFDIPL